MLDGFGGLIGLVAKSFSGRAATDVSDQLSAISNKTVLQSVYGQTMSIESSTETQGKLLEMDSAQKQQNANQSQVKGVQF